MKATFLSLVAAVGLLVSCSTSRIQSTSDNAAYNVPNNIQYSFQALYPGATNVVWGRYDAAMTPVDWELAGWPALDTSDYMVTFNVGPERYHAWYEDNGAWVGSAYTLRDVSLLPIGISRMLADQYKDYTVEKVEKETWKDRQAFEIKLKKGEDETVKLLVDNNGTILKQKIDD
ncbi:MAG TPA: hypothetical protein VHK69_04210 [Chitinophagaceae bacterium]|jgi:hypothetical protein|nr:hypothetical protein [Chitinophagaceae bacterium]